MNTDPYKIQQQLVTEVGTFTYFSLPALLEQGYPIDRLPFSIRILLENALRNFDDFAITREHISSLLTWGITDVNKELPFKPARVLMT